jgi:hypothetical protein
MARQQPAKLLEGRQPRRSREDDHLRSAGVAQSRNDRERLDLERDQDRKRVRS